MRSESRLFTALVAFVCLLNPAFTGSIFYFSFDDAIAHTLDSDNILVHIDNLDALALFLSAIVLGLLLTESGGATRLFAFIGTLGERTRAWIFKAALSLLVLLAGFEGYLGYLLDAYFRAAYINSNLPPPDPSVLMWYVAVALLLPLTLAAASIPIAILVESLRGRPTDLGPIGMRRGAGLFTALAAFICLLNAAPIGYFTFIMVCGNTLCINVNDDLYTLALILTGVGLGLVLTESGRSTRLFAFFGTFGETKRAWIFKIALVLLAGVAGYQTYLIDANPVKFWDLWGSGDLWGPGGYWESLTSTPDLMARVRQVAMAILMPLTLAFASFPIAKLVASLRGRPGDHDDRAPETLPTGE